MSHVTPYIVNSDQLTDKAIDQRIGFNDLNIRISEYIEWKEIKEGHSASFLEIEETHKDILFTDWDAQIKQAELAVARETGVAKNIVKAVNHTFHATNLVKEGNPKSLAHLNDLNKNWKEKVETQREAIAKLSKTVWEAYWQYLVKPHNQIMTLNFSLHSTKRMLPPLTDAIFAG